MVVLGCGKKIESEDGQRIESERGAIFFFFGFYVLLGFRGKKIKEFLFFFSWNPTFCIAA